jgi:Ser/Thr protein kinase RdoA (MazF antagonist)
MHWTCRYGLIHADTHPGNFVIQGERLRLIDFGRLGWGPYLLDIAHCALDMEPAQRGAFLDGYALSVPDTF